MRRGKREERRKREVERLHRQRQQSCSAVGTVQSAIGYAFHSSWRRAKEKERERERERRRANDKRERETDSNFGGRLCVMQNGLPARSARFPALSPMPPPKRSARPPCCSQRCSGRRLWAVRAKRGEKRRSRRESVALGQFFSPPFSFSSALHFTSSPSLLPNRKGAAPAAAAEPTAALLPLWHCASRCSPLPLCCAASPWPSLSFLPLSLFLCLSLPFPPTVCQRGPRISTAESPRGRWRSDRRRRRR